MKRVESTILRQVLLGSLVAVLGPLSALTVNAAAQTYVFGRADFATGASPVALVAGDFNGDGRLDLATANSGDNTVSVLIGRPDGTFQTHVDYKVGTSPSAIATGHFNGDGKPDLAVANSGDSTVSILLGNGDGAFQVAGHYETASAPISIALGNFNGDGKTDMAVANSGSNSVSVLIGNGKVPLALRLTTPWAADRYRSWRAVSTTTANWIWRSPTAETTRYPSSWATAMARSYRRSTTARHPPIPAGGVVTRHPHRWPWQTSTAMGHWIS